MNLKIPRGRTKLTWESTRRLRILSFIILLFVLYSFIGLRINTLTNADPDPEAVTSKAPATSEPYIDPAIVDKIKQLEENNVSVQALFNEARQNPFHE